MFPGVRSFLVFSSFGFKSPATGFWFYSYSSLSTVQHSDKTSRLMVKRFFTVRDTQRGPQSYMEKRRGRREIEVTRRRGVVKGERPITSNQFPKCFPQPRTPTEIHRV